MRESRHLLSTRPRTTSPSGKFDFPFPLRSDVDRRVGALCGALRRARDPYPECARRISYLTDDEGRIACRYEVKDTAARAAEVLTNSRVLQAS